MPRRRRGGRKRTRAATAGGDGNSRAVLVVVVSVGLKSCAMGDGRRVSSNCMYGVGKVVV